MISQPNFRLIIIDDNPDIHKDFIKILTTSSSSETFETLDRKLFGDETLSQRPMLPNFQIDTASQGQEGVERIREAVKNNKPYSLAFVDIRMPPGWDGIETIKHIWKLDPNIQVVICTAYSDYTWEETIEELGVNDNLLILKKPFDNVAVRQLASALTKKWLLMRETKEQMQLLEERVAERTLSLQKSLSLIRATFESSADGILVVDNTDKIVDYNNKLVELWDIPPAVLETNSKSILFEYALNQLEKPEEFLDKVKKINSNPQLINVDVIKFKDRKVFEWYTQPHRLDDKVIGRVWSFRDITKQVYLGQRLEHQATHDALTDLPNRVLLVDRLKQAIGTAKRNNTFVGILFFDLDRFKLINDSFNHAAGDELLKTIAKRLRSLCREQDTLARLGGDEFVMVITELKSEAYLSSIASKLLNAIKQPVKIDSKNIIITASVGISIYPKNGKNVEELLSNADLAMYRGKEAGANRIEFYTAQLNEHSTARLDLETELENALSNNEFFLCYQPQVDLIEKRITAVEALIRWQHPKKGVLLPVEFIRFAEESGQIIPIGEWILKTACQQTKLWQEKGYPPMRVAVNVTTPQIKYPNFIKNVQNILEKTRLQPEFLEIELTENVILENKESITIVNQLKDIGVHIVLDDFGAGNSSISYLKKIHLDGLKIDGSFIKNINTTKSDEVIVKAIITLATGLNLQVTAEGVETQEQLDLLKAQECQDAQGFYFSKPLLAADLEKFLSEDHHFP